MGIALVEAKARESIFNSVSAKEPIQGMVLGVDLDDSVPDLCQLVSHSS